MKPWQVVIGANYGDEGKGLITDYFASKLVGPKLVVRFSGGAQASHMVVTPEGGHHKFSHFGSGTLVGAHTYLADQFIVNLTAYSIESNILKKSFDIKTNVYVSGKCLVTLPIDVAFNQTIELKRGINRHGSCGLGISETIERNLFSSSSEKGPFSITVDDCRNSSELVKLINKIENEWLPLRASQLDLDPAEISEPLAQNMWFWIQNLNQFLDEVIIVNNDIIKSEQFDNNVIFEGAQGLALDQSLFSETNPHVTRSNCGLKNVIDIALELGQDRLLATYVTRCYLTRHGQGPLPNEKPIPSWLAQYLHNSNIWQGSMRYAPLNVEDLNARILNDIESEIYRLGNITFNTAVTCLDQFHEIIDISEIISKRYLSYGPTRDDIVIYP